MTIFLKGLTLGSLPIIYMGLPLGVMPMTISFWNPIVGKFQKKLSSWKK